MVLPTETPSISPLELQRYHALLMDDVPAMMHSIDAQGRLIAVSRKWLAVLGYELSEVIGRKSADFLTEASRHYALETVLPAFFETGACQNVPYQFVARDGRVLDVLLSANSERGADGAILHSLAVMQDVTPLRRSEQKLRAAVAYSQQLFHTANAMIVELDPAGRIRRINPMAEEITGYRQEEVKGRNWFELLAPHERFPALREDFERVLRTPGHSEIESPIVTRRGQEKIISWRNSCLNQDGAPIAILSIGIDVTEQRALERHLRMSETALKEAQTVAHIGSWIRDHQTKELIWSDEVFNILEIDHAVGASKDAFLARIHPEDREEVKNAYRRSLTYHRPYEIRHRLLLPDGSIKYVHQRSETISDGVNPFARSLGTIQDVTLAVLQEMAYKESEERFRTVADFTYDWEYWEGPAQEILYISPSCMRVTGYSQAEFITDPALARRIIHPEDQEMYASHLEASKGSPGSQTNFRIVRKDGEIRWIAHGRRPVMDSEGRPRGQRISNRDISDLKHAEELASRLAHFDTLTGLPNRRLLHDRLQNALSQAVRYQRSMAVMFIDLDKFKQINDTLGHDVGDLLLVEASQRLVGCIRQSDTVARTGGDEFIIVLPVIQVAADACAVAEKICGALRQPFQLGEHRLEISSSIGIAVRPKGSADDALELMKKADIAMYAAKQAGRDGYRLFEAEATPG